MAHANATGSGARPATYSIRTNLSRDPPRLPACLLRRGRHVSPSLHQHLRRQSRQNHRACADASAGAKPIQTHRSEKRA